MIFLKERSLPSALRLRQQRTFGKKKKERLTYEASKSCFVCKPFSFFLSSDFPSVACFRCRMPFKRMAGSGKVFGLNTLHRGKILPETALSPDLAAVIRAMRYLCIRASGTGD